MTSYEDKLESDGLGDYVGMLGVFSRIAEEHFLEGEKRFTQGILKMIINGDLVLAGCLENFVRNDLMFFYD